MVIYKLSGGFAKKIRQCLAGELKCLKCGEKSSCAIESWSGYKPACKKCGKIAEKLGWHIIWENERIPKNDN